MMLATNVQPEQVQDVPLFESIEAAWPTLTGLSPAEHEYDTVSQAMVLDGPGPMARRSDNVMSHRAADRVAVKRRAVLEKVLYLVRTTGPLRGSEINEAYDRLQRQHPDELPRVAWDTPRKRAGELAKADLIEYVTDGVRGHEGLYRRPAWQVQS